MKYRIKYLICNLLAGLTALMFSCSRKGPSLELISTKQLNYPSASAIEFYNNHLYVIGDDASYLLILSPDYQPVDSISIWNTANGRIAKAEKHDLESAFVQMNNHEPVLYSVGSMSTERRWKVLIYHLKNQSYSFINFFQPGTTFPNVDAVNIEGSSVFGDMIILSNRANLSNPDNHLIFINPKQEIMVKRILLPTHEITAGISGLHYLKEKDILLFTASEEETASTVLDGTIGDSYLGWIENFSHKFSSDVLNPDHYMKLSEVDKAFVKEKIESVCVEKFEDNDLLIHLAADNDNGSSSFFKLRLKL